MEWVLPELIDVFTSTDKAVEFEPRKAQDVQEPSRPPTPAITSSTSRIMAS